MAPTTSPIAATAKHISCAAATDMLQQLHADTVCRHCWLLIIIMLLLHFSYAPKDAPCCHAPTANCVSINERPMQDSTTQCAAVVHQIACPVCTSVRFCTGHVCSIQAQYCTLQSPSLKLTHNMCHLAVVQQESHSQTTAHVDIQSTSAVLPKHRLVSQPPRLNNATRLQA